MAEQSKAPLARHRFGIVDEVFQDHQVGMERAVDGEVMLHLLHGVVVADSGIEHLECGRDPVAIQFAFQDFGAVPANGTPQPRVVESPSHHDAVNAGRFFGEEIRGRAAPRNSIDNRLPSERREPVRPVRRS